MLFKTIHVPEIIFYSVAKMSSLRGQAQKGDFNVNSTQDIAVTMDSIKTCRGCRWAIPKAKSVHNQNA